MRWHFSEFTALLAMTNWLDTWMKSAWKFRIFRFITSPGNGTMDFQEFVQLMSKKNQYEMDVGEAKEAFRIFDPDDRGYVLTAELRQERRTGGKDTWECVERHAGGQKPSREQKSVFWRYGLCRIDRQMNWYRKIQVCDFVIISSTPRQSGFRNMIKLNHNEIWMPAIFCNLDQFRKRVALGLYNLQLQLILWP